MRQVTFSTQSLDAMSGLSQNEQLVLVEKLSSLSTDILTNKNENVSKFSRKGMTYYRIRIDDLESTLNRMDQLFTANLFWKEILFRILWFVVIYHLQMNQLWKTIKVFGIT
mgnify:CR=1 FL=1